jgi:hypothetical protein
MMPDRRPNGEWRRGALSAVLLVQIGHSVVQVCGPVVHARSCEVHGFVAVVLLGSHAFHFCEVPFLLRQFSLPNGRLARVLGARLNSLIPVAHAPHIARSRSTLRALAQTALGDIDAPTYVYRVM